VYWQRGQYRGVHCAGMSEQATSRSPERREDHSVEYGASYYLNYWGGDGPYERNERWLKFFDDIAEHLVRDFRPASALDAGCAMGFLVEALRKRGVEASGIDVSEYAIGQVEESVAEHCEVASLTEPLAGRYDLITCIEVLEHLPTTETDRAIANLCAATDRLLISSTPGDFGEPTHLNVQPPETWSAKLAQHGFLRDLDHDLSYVSPWAALYVRRDEPATETVRRYDRVWWQLRREVVELRQALLKAQEQLSESEAERRPELLEELKEREQEVLRLRDLLIGKDAELGAAKGRLAELEDHRMRLAGAKHRLAAQVPGLRRLLGAVLRVLRDQRG
jgi:SAM-dependent methyltransferase